MGGRLWASLVMVCVCFLVIMRDDIDQHAPWDNRQPERQRSSLPKTGYWTAHAPDMKLNSRDDSPPAVTSRRNLLVPVEKQIHTRMRRAVVIQKDDDTSEEELGTIYLPEFTKARNKGKTGTQSPPEDMDVLQEREVSWNLKNWTSGKVDLLGNTDVSEDMLSISVRLDSTRKPKSTVATRTPETMEESGDMMSTTEPSTTVTIPSSIVTTWTSETTDESGDTIATREPTTTVTIPSSIITSWTSGSTEVSGDMTATTTPTITVTMPSSTTTVDITTPISPVNTSSSPSPTTPTPTTIPTTAKTLTIPPPTTTTPRTTTTPITTTTSNPGQCQNGATWDGNKCVCPDGYYGIYCETAICQNGGTWSNGVCQCTENFQGFECQFAKETIEIKDATVNATVEMKAKIENRQFNEELKNKSSAAFKEFEMEFKDQMNEVYKHVVGYQGVVIHELTRGSIVVNYTVLLKVLASITANETVDNISKNLVSAFNNYTSCNQSCETSECALCFNSTFTTVTNYGVQDIETNLCNGHIPEDFESYYSPLLTTTGVLCISRCDKRSADPYSCVHGTCTVARSGPQCTCSEQSAFWYQDSACSSRISKVGVAVGVPVAGLVMVIAIFTVFLARARRQKEEYRNKLTSRSELYCSTDESWTGSQGFAASNQAATWEALENPNTTYINLERVDTSQKIHIQRPSHIVIP